MSWNPFAFRAVMREVWWLRVGPIRVTWPVLIRGDALVIIWPCVQRFRS